METGSMVWNPRGAVWAVQAGAQAPFTHGALEEQLLPRPRETLLSLTDEGAASPSPHQYTSQLLSFPGLELPLFMASASGLCSRTSGLRQGYLCE